MATSYHLPKKRGALKSTKISFLRATQVWDLSQISKSNWTWKFCSNLILYLWIMYSISSWENGHCIHLCPMSPHLVQTLNTCSYLHWIHCFVPSSRLSMNPTKRGSQGSIWILTLIKWMFLGRSGSQSIVHQANNLA